MNQILVTEKVYVTPELKRKKRFFKLEFILSLCLVLSLTSFYIYAEYDRNQKESVSQEILSSINLENVADKELIDDDTKIKVKNNAIVVHLDDDVVLDEDINIGELVNATYSNNKPEKIIHIADDGTEYYTVAILRIPKIDLNYPVLSYSTEELLKNSLNKLWGPEPNEVGNFCIVGHNYKNKKMFGRLDEVVIGDIAEITDLNGMTLKYKVYDIYTVDPSDVRCTSQKTNGKREITLITCTPNGKLRLIVKASAI